MDLDRHYLSNSELRAELRRRRNLRVTLVAVAVVLGLAVTALYIVR